MWCRELKLSDIDQIDIDRFWRKVNRKNLGSCWQWSAGKDKDGYGRFGLKRKVIRAHRFSYIINIGPVSNTILCLHKCDFTSCVNPRQENVK